MSDLVNEQLSACLDGELSEAELRLLLKRSERDAQIARPLDRYALIGEALRGSPVHARQDFSSRVMAALADEAPAELTPAQRLSPMLRYLRPVAGLAVAASVATVAVLSLQQPVGNGAAPAMLADGGAPASQVEAVAPSYVVPSITSPVRNSPVAVPAARLTNYVVAHSEYSSPLGRRSVLTGVLASDNEDEDQELQVVITDDAADDKASQSQAGERRPDDVAAPADAPDER